MFTSDDFKNKELRDLQVSVLRQMDRNEQMRSIQQMRDFTDRNEQKRMIASQKLEQYISQHGGVHSTPQEIKGYIIIAIGMIVGCVSFDVIHPALLTIIVISIILIGVFTAAKEEPKKPAETNTEPKKESEEEVLAKIDSAIDAIKNKKKA